MELDSLWGSRLGCPSTVQNWYPWRPPLVMKKQFSTIHWLLASRTFWPKYIGADGEEHRPVMIHRGLFNERLQLFYCKNYKEFFPTWLYPNSNLLSQFQWSPHYAGKQQQSQTVVSNVEVMNGTEMATDSVSQTQNPLSLIVGDKENRPLELLTFVVMDKTKHIQVSVRISENILLISPRNTPRCRIVALLAGANWLLVVG